MHRHTHHPSHFSSSSRGGGSAWHEHELREVYLHGDGKMRGLYAPSDDDKESAEGGG